MFSCQGICFLIGALISLAGPFLVLRKKISELPWEIIIGAGAITCLVLAFASQV